MALDACQQHTRPPTFPVAELNHAGFDKLRAKVFLPLSSTNAASHSSRQMGTLAFQGVWGVNRDRVADLMHIVLGSSLRLFAFVIRHRFCPNLRQVKARKRTGSGEQPKRARNKHLCVLEEGTVATLNLGDGVPLR